MDVWDIDSEGQEYLVKANVQVKRVADLRFLLPEQTVNNKGRIYKARCRVYDDIRKESYTIQMSYQRIKQLIDEMYEHEMGGPKVGFTR